MRSHPAHCLLAGMVLVLMPGISSGAANAPVPRPPMLSNPTENPYLQVGMDAMASGLRTFTISVEVGPDSNLPQRINDVHFGMSLSGWNFIAQEVLTRQGNSSILLLTYARRIP